MNRRIIPAWSLQLVAPGTPVDPTVSIGDWVMLGSGGPFMLVVDLAGPDRLIAAWRNEDSTFQEDTFPRACVPRAIGPRRS